MITRRVALAAQPSASKGESTRSSRSRRRRLSQALSPPVTIETGAMYFERSADSAAQ